MANPFVNIQAPIWAPAVFMAAALTPNLLIGPLSQTPEARAPLMAPRIIAPRLQQTWTQNLLASTLAPSFQLRAPLQAPRSAARAAITSSAPPNLLLTLLGSTNAPFKNLDSGLPRGWALDRSTGGFTATVYLSANTPPLSLYDWPLTIRAPRLEQTWTQNLLQSTLTPPAYQLRVPLQAPQITAARPLIGQPPNLLLSTLAPTGTPAPFASPDSGLPKAMPRTLARDAQGTPLALQTAIPFTQTDCPTPRASQTRIRGDAQGIPLVIFASIQGQPFTSPDSQPKRAPRLEQTWSCNLLQTTLSGPTPVPFIPADWRLPSTAAQIDRSSSQNLLFTTLAAVPVPFATPDRALPVRAAWFDRGWTSNLLESTLGPAVLPVGATTPPGPRIVARVSIGDGQAIPFTLFIGAQGRPFPNQDWPLPRRAPRLEQTWAFASPLVGAPPILVGGPRFIVRIKARPFAIARNPARSFAIARGRPRQFMVSAVTQLRFDTLEPSSEAYPLTFDFTPDLNAGETVIGITSVAISVVYGTDPSPSAILNGAAAIDVTGKKVIQGVKNAVVNTDYQLIVTVTTTNVLKNPVLVGVLPVRL